jgi:hypothetical protein
MNERRQVRVEYIRPGANWDEDAQDGGRVAYADQVQAGIVPASLRGPNFVAMAPQPARPATIDATWLRESQPTAVADVWQPRDGAREATSAMDRSKALCVRLLPFVGIWSLISLVVGIVAGIFAQRGEIGALVAVLVLAVVTAIKYERLNRIDYEYSREGTERLRILEASDIERRRMDHEQELKKTALGIFLKILTIGDDR